MRWRDSDENFFEFNGIAPAERRSPTRRESAVAYPTRRVGRPALRFMGRPPQTSARLAPVNRGGQANGDKRIPKPGLIRLAPFVCHNSPPVHGRGRASGWRKSIHFAVTVERITRVVSPKVLRPVVLPATGLVQVEARGNCGNVAPRRFCHGIVGISIMNIPAKLPLVATFLLTVGKVWSATLYVSTSIRSRQYNCVAGFRGQ